jgi:hypothetical protein
MVDLKPLLSVVVLCRDNPDQLSDTLAALHRAGPWPQAIGWPDVMEVELLVVDSSSNGTAAGVLAAWQVPPGWRSRHQFLSPKGVYHAMNQALQAAAGEAIVFMNAGDVYIPGGLHILLRHWLALARPAVVVGQAWVDPFPSASIPCCGPWLSPDPGLRPERLARWLVHMVPCHQACLFATYFARSHPYDLQVGPTADRAVMRAALAEAMEVVGHACYLPQVVCRHRLGGISSGRIGLNQLPARLLSRGLRRREKWGVFIKGMMDILPWVWPQRLLQRARAWWIARIC